MPPGAGKNRKQDKQTVITPGIGGLRQFPEAVPGERRGDFAGS
jgi:hypothetical protein